MSKALVIYHKHCPSGDGFASAFAAWLALGEGADYYPADYGDPIPPAAGRDVFILDLSFEESALLVLSEEAASLTLLDHHLSAQRRLSHFKPVCCGKIHFDMSQCGCVLAWEHFHPTAQLPRLFRWIRARDLWTWDEPDAKEFLAWLDTQPKDFPGWLAILNLSDEELSERIRLGAAFLSQREGLCESIASGALSVLLCGEAGLMVNGSPEFRSEVGSLLAERSGTFGLLWRVVEGGQVLCSLRSRPPYDVERLATKFGGGGHLTSASFTLPVSKLAELAQGSLEP